MGLVVGAKLCRNGLRTLGALLAALTGIHPPAFANCTGGVGGEFPVTMVGTTPVIAGSINGMEARFLPDSGAYYSLLTDEAAKRYKVARQFLEPGFAIYGVGGAESVSLGTAKDFNLVGFNAGPIRNAQFLVVGNTLGGGIAGVIGQNILGFADTEYDLANGVIRLVRVKGCEGRSLAYWSKSQTAAELPIEWQSRGQPHILATAKLNGKDIRVMFDTGAGTSMLTKRAAARLGVTPETDGVVAGSINFGIGRGSVDTWIAPFASLDFGDEQIKNIKLRIGDFELAEADMLVGVDFFLSHRVYVANSQHKLYFTYNGGPVFDLAVRSENTGTTQATAPQTEEQAGASRFDNNSPKDAAGYRRRATASAARGDQAGAISDLDHAVELDPSDPENYYQRAIVRIEGQQPQLAMADLAQALKLKPDEVAALVLRGQLRLKAGDDAGASADFAQASRLAPHDAGVSLRIANSYFATGNMPEAIARYDQWIVSFPSDDRLPVALANRCLSRAVLGQHLDLALKDCDAALHRSPDNSDYLDSRAFVRLRRGDLDGAMKDYRAALKLQPKLASARYGLGVVEARKGMKNDADRDIQAALAQEPRVADQFKSAGLTP